MTVGSNPAQGGNPDENDPASATTPTTQAPQPKPEEADPAKFSPEQQNFLNRLVGEARKEGREAAERAAEEERQKKEEEAARADSVRKGKFDEAEASYKENISNLTSERDGLKTKVGEYEKIMAARVTEIKDSLPEAALADFPKDADSLEQISWLETRKSLVASLMPQETTTTSPPGTKPRVPPSPTPKPSGEGDNPKVTPEQQAAVDRRYRRF